MMTLKEQIECSDRRKKAMEVMTTITNKLDEVFHNSKDWNDAKSEVRKLDTEMNELRKLLGL